MTSVQAGASRQVFPLLRNTIAAQVQTNIGRLPSARAEAGDIERMQ